MRKANKQDRWLPVCTPLNIVGAPRLQPLRKQARSPVPPAAGHLVHLDTLQPLDLGGHVPVLRLPVAYVACGAGRGGAVPGSGSVGTCTRMQAM